MDQFIYFTTLGKISDLTCTHLSQQLCDYLHSLMAYKLLHGNILPIKKITVVGRVLFFEPASFLLSANLELPVIHTHTHIQTQTHTRAIMIRRYMKK